MLSLSLKLNDIALQILQAIDSAKNENMLFTYKSEESHAFETICKLIGPLLLK